MTYVSCTHCDGTPATGHTPRCPVRDAAERIAALRTLARDLGLGTGRGWRTRLVAWVAARDGSTCQLCSAPVDLTLPSGPRGHLDGPSLDHEHPRSQGGPDTLDNLRLTHWRCNRDEARRAA